MLPASAEHIAFLTDALLTVMPRSEAANFDHFWKDMLQISTAKIVTPSLPCMPSASELEFGQQDTCFSTLAEDAGKTLITLDKAKLDWGLRVDKDLTLRRQVLDGGDILVLMNGIKIEVSHKNSPSRFSGHLRWSLQLLVV